MVGIKEGELYYVPTAEDAARRALQGVFHRDTVYFDRWEWTVPNAQRLSRWASGAQLREYHATVDERRTQVVELIREVTVTADALTDRWTVKNYSDAEQVVTLSLASRARMVDLFALMRASDAQVVAAIAPSPQERRYTRTAADGLKHVATLSFDAPPADNGSWTVTLAPKGTGTLQVSLSIDTAHDPAADVALPDHAEWRASFGSLADGDPAVMQAVDDLRALLLATLHGPYPAAGMPVFVNFFGRDGLITGLMLLRWRPDVLRAVLGFLAANQGRTVDPFREEEPGKIMHEIRRGELSRTGQIPFGRYFGSVDWLVAHLAGPTGLATFEASGSGLTVQSWKDSPNSMVDEHGAQARQPLAVAEVQGYAYAGLLAAARLLPDRAAALTERASALRDTFHRLYWLPERGTYAMALDAAMRPLRVLSSDAGHLLWSGIVPEGVAPTLVGTLMSPAMWSGWGLRTLGADEAAYNPVSYHNGSVWPHDTALFGLGLARYGFDAELRRVARATLDLAAASDGRHIPELIAGYGRDETPVPVAYSHANAPQAWAAAGVVAMAGCLADLAPANREEAA